MRVHPWAVCILILAFVRPAAAQSTQAERAENPQDRSTFRSSIDIITVDAVVTDSHGRHVTDLTRDDFEVILSGRRQDLQQVVYVRAAEQPYLLSARSPGDPATTSGGRSAASLALKQTGVQPNQIVRTVALVVDDLGLSFRGVVDTRTMLHRFIDTQMQPGDLVAIVRTGGGSGALQQFTADKRLLHRAADAVQFSFRSRNSEWGGAGRISGFIAAESGDRRRDDGDVDQLREDLASVGSLGAVEYVAHGISELPGRKCIVFLSEGFSELFYERQNGGWMWQALTRMLAQANAAGVVVNTLDVRGLVTGGLTAEDDPQQVQTGISGTYDAQGLVRDTARSRIHELLASQEAMWFIASQTGGLAITNTNDLNGGLQRILDDQSGYYLLGYLAPNNAPRSGWVQDRVSVRVKRPGLRVRARQGFFGPSDPTSPRGFGFDGLTNAALSPFSSTGITARLTSVFAHDGERRGYVRSLLFIDTNDLKFEEPEPGRHTAAFEISVLAVGDTGRIAGQWRRLANVVLNDQQFRGARERGIVYSMRTTIKDAGAYQIRAAVRDVHTKLTGSASQFLEVPKVGSGKLAVSGVLLKGLADASEVVSTVSAPDAPVDGLVDAVLLEPEVRVFRPGSDLVYAYEIYDGLDPKTSAGLQMGTALLRNGEVVYRSPFTPVNAAARGTRKLRAIPIAGKLALGADMPQGPYTLEIIVRTSDAKPIERRQWLDFEVRNVSEAVSGSSKQ